MSEEVPPFSQDIFIQINGGVEQPGSSSGS